MISVMISSASAENRVASPSTSRIGNTCSAIAAEVAASVGSTSGSLYSLRNSSTADALSRQPSTLVSPDCQNTPAIDRRAMSAIAQYGMALSTAMKDRTMPSIELADAGAVEAGVIAGISL